MRTTISSRQVANQSIEREDVNITTPSKALITKILAGSGLVEASRTGADIGTGDVTLTTKPYSFSAYKNTPQSFSTSTNTKLTFESINFGASYWNATSNRYIVPVDGTYLIVGAVTLEASNISARLYLYKNGAVLTTLDNTTSNMFNGTSIEQFVAGDYIELYAWTSRSATAQITDTFFNVCRVG